MKNILMSIGLCLLLVGTSVAENHNIPKGKHKSHKKTKKKKSSYFYNFQH